MPGLLRFFCFVINILQRKSFIFQIMYNHIKIYFIWVTKFGNIINVIEL